MSMGKKVAVFISVLSTVLLVMSYYTLKLMMGK